MVTKSENKPVNVDNKKPEKPVVEPKKTTTHFGCRIRRVPKGRPRV